MSEYNPTADDLILAQAFLAMVTHNPRSTHAWLAERGSHIIAQARESALARADALLEEVAKPGVFGGWLAVEDPILKETNLEDLCEQVGYGAVMAYASYLWKERAERDGHAGSEHTVAACAAVRRHMLEKIRAYLAERAKGD